MAALTSSDVTITKVRRHRVGLMRECIYQVVFGDAAKTYPTNGVPLPLLALFGAMTRVDFFELVPVTIDGYGYKYDKTNHTIRKFQVAGHAHDLKLIGGITASEPAAVHSDAVTFGKNAATDRTIAGADSATKGGVIALAAAAFSEMPTTHAPAATTLLLKLQGK
jgi:hypothetical protein